MTIPKSTLFPMCGMNLAFDRDLIGPAMYFGLMGEGQPIGRYDDMWAGWCVKVHFNLPLVIDHLCISNAIPKSTNHQHVIRFLISFTGNLRPFGAWSEDRASIHMAQQSKQPFCELEKGVQRHILARRDHSIFPSGCPSKGVHYCSSLLYRVVEAS